MASVSGGYDIFIQCFSDYGVAVSDGVLVNGRWAYECWPDVTRGSFLLTVPAYLPASYQLRLIETELRMRGLSRGTDA